jgi:hypothetical protein
VKRVSDEDLARVAHIPPAVMDGSAAAFFTNVAELRAMAAELLDARAVIRASVAVSEYAACADPDFRAQQLRELEGWQHRYLERWGPR